MIPYSKQDISEADIKAVARAIKQPFLTQGPAIERFEQHMAKVAGTTHAVAVSSGTAALHVAYYAAGIQEGDEVIMPAMTFAATANAALYVKAVPVFADIDLEYATIDVADVERKITKKTKAIVVVDFAGRPGPYSELRALAKKHKLILIADSAHSFGATYKGKQLGTQADLTTFSFHPVKSITTGEGGAIVTNNTEYYERMKMFRTHGITKDPRFLINKNEGPWYQEMHELGFNYRLTDIQAMLGDSQLKRLPGLISKRRAIAKRYHSILSKIPGIILPPVERAYETSAWHLYPIRIANAKNRKAVFEALHANGIKVQVHYVPVYFHPYYQKLGYKKGACPNAEQFYNSEISIPIFPSLTRKEQDLVAHTLTKILHQFS